MVHPSPLMLEGVKNCDKKQKEESRILSSPPKLSSSIFDSGYVDAENNNNTSPCNNSTIKRSIKGGVAGQYKTIAFSDLIPEHSPPLFVRNGSPRKVSLTPRICCRKNDDAQCNLGPVRENYLQITDSFSSEIRHPAATSPRPSLEPSSPPFSSSIDAVQAAEEGDEAVFDFMLTPTVLYGTTDQERAAAEEDHHQSRRPQSVPVKRYHRSPHWSGKVNINPFSPVPEQYLKAPPILDIDPEKKKANKRARLSPTKVVTSFPIHHIANVPVKNFQQATEKKRKANYCIQDEDDGEWKVKPNDSNNNNIYKRIFLPNQRSRYLDDFEEIQFLGSGSFGTVCACLSRLDGCMYAIKSISPDGHVVPRRNGDVVDDLSPNSFYGGRNSSQTLIAPPTPRRDGIPSSVRRHRAQSRLSPNDKESSSHHIVLRGSGHWNHNALHRMLREVFALAALCNKSDSRTFHIVRYHQAWLEDDGILYIQTELCKSTLRDEMKSGKTMNVYRQFKILREVLLALQLVHEQGCVHLDIKPENIFVKDDVYKLGDFGMVTMWNDMNSDTGEVMGVEEGDSRYMPRDLLEINKQQDLTKSDIFSLGITLYESCYGRPLPICGQEWHDLRDGKFSKSLNINPTLYVFMRQMMHPDPSKRPSATDLLSRSELIPNSDNVFLSLINNSSSKGTHSLPLKRSYSWTM